MIIDENYPGLKKNGFYFELEGDLVADFLDIRIKLFVKGKIKAGRWIEAGSRCHSCLGSSPGNRFPSGTRHAIADGPAL